MGKRLEGFGEVWTVDETNGFGLDLAEKTESGFWPYVGAVLQRRTDLGLIYFIVKR